MSEDLNKQIETSTKLLSQLEAERTDLPTKMAIAAEDADSASLISLKRRVTEIPTEIFGAQVRLKRLQLKRNEERLPKLRAEVEQFTEPLQAAITKRDDAVRELEILRGQYHSVNEDLKQLKSDIGRQKREIDDLVYSAKPKTGASATLSTHFGR